MDDTVLIADIGKTRTKLTLLAAGGRIVAMRDRINGHPGGTLDREGIAAWLAGQINELATLAPIGAIVPVAHGATAALVDRDDSVHPVLDYETEPPVQIAQSYDSVRDPFAQTLSPRLPAGLNLGVQIHWQDTTGAKGEILLWPQYWSWWLSGVRAAERTSLGCHTDLWQPAKNTFSNLAQQRGWSVRFPPMRGATETLGFVRRSLAPNLPSDCAVLCGIHDSNAALHAIRAHKLLMGMPFAVVSTGTWFVTLQTGTSPVLNPAFDCLGSVDVAGAIVPTARFMGGRDYESLMGPALGTIATTADVAEMLADEPSRFIAADRDQGKYRFTAHDALDALPPGRRAALASLYLALNTNLALQHLDAAGPVVIEGRFARDSFYPAMLARLRPRSTIYACELHDGVALGAARLWWPDLVPPFELTPVAPLAVAIEGFELGDDHAQGT